ncbi:hypothetical protein [Streptomyces sp. SCSIO ZS0520]|uniref:hypothetical protein n=1 Tax=Streptomyces sp. SCSIO ZS0520 TaxID=2892996 RepID=UPI0021DB72E0|nr:hypothetical protein [Streptomyces sp. SCSIO ZS0520]
MSVVTYFPGRGIYREPAYLEGKEVGKEEGAIEAKAAVVVRVLELRGIEVSQDVRERMAGCADPVLLDRWLERAPTATRAEALFEQPSTVGQAPAPIPAPASEPAAADSLPQTRQD